MSIFSTTEVILACAASRSAIGRASYRALPARLDVRDNEGGPAANERAGRVLQRLDDGLLDVEPERLPDLGRWLRANAVEVVYQLSCPVHGEEWALAPEIARAIRHNRGASSWVNVRTH